MTLGPVHNKVMVVLSEKHRTLPNSAGPTHEPFGTFVPLAYTTGLTML